MFNFDKVVDFLYGQKGKSNILNYFKKTHVRVYLIILSLSNLSQWLFARFIYSAVDRERMALHYNVDFGIDFYGGKEKIFILPLISFSIIIFNLILCLFFASTKNNIFISHILFLTSIVTNSIILLSIALIYLVNFS